MNHCTGALLFCLAVAAPACAQQGPKDFEMLNKYAGTWAVDCGKAGTRLTVGVKTLTLSANGKKMHTAAPLAAFSYYGRMEPPAGFDVALLGAAPPSGLSFLAMSDPSGPYLTVDADPHLQKKFGKAALAGKFRRCP